MKLVVWESCVARVRPGPPAVSLPEAYAHRIGGRRLPIEIEPIDSAEEKWEACAARCSSCGESWLCVVEIGLNEATLDCPSCREFAGAIVVRCDAGHWRMVA